MTKLLKHGHAGEEIVKQVEAGGHDLLALGSRGLGRLASRVLGSTGADVHIAEQQHHDARRCIRRTSEAGESGLAGGPAGCSGAPLGRDDGSGCRPGLPNPPERLRWRRPQSGWKAAASIPEARRRSSARFWIATRGAVDFTVLISRIRPHRRRPRSGLSGDHRDESTPHGSDRRRRALAYSSCRSAPRRGPRLDPRRA